MKDKKHKKMEHGWYAVDIPEGATEMGDVNALEVDMPFESYAELVDGTYYPETEELFGLFVWNEEEPEISQCVIDDTTVEIQPLLGGHHPAQKPK